MFRRYIMPYRRRYSNNSRRRTSYRRYNRRSQSTSLLSQAQQTALLARRAWAGLKYLRTLVNVEHKKYDAQHTATVGTSPTSIFDPTAIAQGDTDQSRNGNSILCKSLYVKGSVSLHASATATQVRILVSRDKQQVSDTAPSFTDIIDPTFSDNIHAPLNNETVGRFQILADFVITVDSNTPVKEFKIYRKMLAHMRFNGVASTDIQKGGIYVSAVSNDQTNQPTVLASGRLVFVDN